MIRRAAFGAAVALILILAPTAAATAYSGSMASHEAGSKFTVSEQTPVVGAPFAADVSGSEPDALVTLTIAAKPGAGPAAGNRTVREVAKASGVANFTVTLTEAGVYTLTATAADGDVVGTQTVTVIAAGAAAGGKANPEGSGGTSLAVGAVVLALVGAVAALLARRRRSAQLPA